MPRHVKHDYAPQKCPSSFEAPAHNRGDFDCYNGRVEHLRECTILNKMD